MHPSSYLSPQKKTEPFDEYTLSNIQTPESKKTYTNNKNKQYLDSASSDFENIPLQMYSAQKYNSQGLKLDDQIQAFPTFKKTDASDRFIPLRQNNNVSKNLFSLNPKDLEIQFVVNPFSQPNNKMLKQKKNIINPEEDEEICQEPSHQQNLFAQNFQQERLDRANNQVQSSQPVQQSPNQEIIQSEEEEKTKNYQDMLKEQTLQYTPKKLFEDMEDEDQNQNPQQHNQFLQFQDKKSNFSDFYNSPFSQQQKLFPNNNNNQSISENESPYSYSDNKNIFQNFIGTKSCYSSGSKIPKRKIQTTPVKVLDAPGLSDDFYMDMLDWNCHGYIAVGLANTIYLWNSNPQQNSDEQQVIQLTSQHEPKLQYTSLKYSKNPNLLALGQHSGQIKVFDIQKQLQIYESHIQLGRVGNLAWINQNLLASGSKDRSLLIQDIRDKPTNIVKQFRDHKQEICGIATCSNEIQLASGGNDNLVQLYDLRQQARSYTFKEHRAAVRALAFSPHQHGVLVTGGGSRDKTIKTWDTNTNQLVGSIDVDSQVCKLLFSENSHEFVSSHGFETNSIIVWKSQNLKSNKIQKLQVLEGHQNRVLFMALSPDNQRIVTGAGDETLKFWNVFPEKKVGLQSQLLGKNIATSLR
ncbi:WD40-repeat-containing domain [Pseudocohnilembus persalinus]|uniref:WD40-repeat-containing domain n=1 Tax=Pseudocohnilembus persalinus TaxID=266149 RepID=A0A0V0QRS8_PSEPJ|nr:WD40-repeat-containing domain [Pseudocohnilembus persalinus]|eukprot:KRX04645.1 WD40-repeat-containing domain [Pseudocohnilembus persalinus]